MTRSQRFDVARARRLQPGQFTVRHHADARRLSRRSAARDVDPEVFPVPAPPPPASPPPPWLSGSTPNHFDLPESYQPSAFGKVTPKMPFSAPSASPR